MRCWVSRFQVVAAGIPHESSKRGFFEHLAILDFSRSEYLSFSLSPPSRLRSVSLLWLGEEASERRELCHAVERACARGIRRRCQSAPVQLVGRDCGVAIRQCTLGGAREIKKESDTSHEETGLPPTLASQFLCLLRGRYTPVYSRYRTSHAEQRPIACFSLSSGEGEGKRKPEALRHRSCHLRKQASSTQ